MSPVSRKIARWSSRTAYFEFRYNNRDNTDIFGAAIALRPMAFSIPISRLRRGGFSFAIPTPQTTPQRSHRSIKRPLPSEFLGFGAGHRSPRGQITSHRAHLALRRAGASAGAGSARSFDAQCLGAQARAARGDPRQNIPPDTISVDLAASAGAHTLAKQVCGLVGDRLDILVPNAGIAP